MIKLYPRAGNGEARSCFSLKNDKIVILGLTLYDKGVIITIDDNLVILWKEV